MLSILCKIPSRMFTNWAVKKIRDQIMDKPPNILESRSQKNDSKDKYED